MKNYLLQIQEFSRSIVLTEREIACPGKFNDGGNLRSASVLMSPNFLSRACHGRHVRRSFSNHTVAGYDTLTSYCCAGLRARNAYSLPVLSKTMRCRSKGIPGSKLVSSDADKHGTKNNRNMVDHEYLKSIACEPCMPPGIRTGSIRAKPRLINYRGSIDPLETLQI